MSADGRKNQSPRRAQVTGGVPTVWLEWTPPALHMLFLALIVFAMTPYTYRLDAIKMAFFLQFGAAMFLLAIWPMIRGVTPPPHRILLVGLLAYGLALALSSVLSEFSWPGPHHFIFYWSCVGFFLGGYAFAVKKKTANAFVLYATLLLLGTNLFGFFQYDVWGNGNTGARFLYDGLYGEGQGDLGTFQRLLWTFASDGKISLMSTILNRDFYAAFCLLYFPFALCLSLSTTRTWLRVLGIGTTMLSLISIFLCKSKGEYISAVMALVLFASLYSVAIRKPDLRRGHLAMWLGGGALLFAVLTFVNFPTLASQLKSVAYSVGSRQIIFSGAIKIFQEHTIFGAGPGTFRLYFPGFRDPNYFEHEISNVTNFAHSYFLDILSETGIVGLLAFMLFALPLAYLGFRVVFRASSPSLRLMAIATLCGLMGMYGSNMTSVSARWPVGAVGLWTVMGVLAGLVRRERDERAEEGETGGAFIDNFHDFSRRPTSWALVSIVLGLFIVSVYGANHFWLSRMAYGDAISDSTRLRNVAVQVIQGKQKVSAKQRSDLISKLAECTDLYRQAIDLDSTYLSAYYKLGSLESILSSLDTERDYYHLQKSFEAYNTLAGYAPDYAEIHYNLGIIHYRLSTYLSARIARIDPAQVDTREALELERTSHDESSLHHFERMGLLSNKSEVISNLGETYLKLGQNELAFETYKKGLELYPEKAIFARQYYKVCGLLENPEGQIDGLVALWRIQPGKGEIIYGKGGALHVAHAKKLPEKFDAVFAEVLERNPVNVHLYAVGAMNAQSRGQNDLATQYGRAFVRTGGTDPTILQSAFKGAAQAGDRDLAKAFYRDVIEGKVGGEELQNIAKEQLTTTESKGDAAPASVPKSSPDPALSGPTGGG